MYRDVKPNNCLIAPDGTLRLTDFGLSRTYGSPEPHYTPMVSSTALHHGGPDKDAAGWDVRLCVCARWLKMWQPSAPSMHA